VDPKDCLDSFGKWRNILGFSEIESRFFGCQVRGLLSHPGAWPSRSHFSQAISFLQVSQTKLFIHVSSLLSMLIDVATTSLGDRGGTVVKVLCCKSEGRWFDPITSLRSHTMALGSIQPLTDMSTRSISWG
jgi:hypothetical protein